MTELNGGDASAIIQHSLSCTTPLVPRVEFWHNAGIYIWFPRIHLAAIVTRNYTLKPNTGVQCAVQETNSHLSFNHILIQGNCVAIVLTNVSNMEDAKKTQRKGAEVRAILESVSAVNLWQGLLHKRWDQGPQPGAGVIAPQTTWGKHCGPGIEGSHQVWGRVNVGRTW